MAQLLSQGTLLFTFDIYNETFSFRQETADLPSAEKRADFDQNSVVENPMTMDHLTVVTKLTTLDE